MNHLFLLVFLIAIPIYFVVEKIEKRRVNGEGNTSLYQKAQNVGLRSQHQDTLFRPTRGSASFINGIDPELNDLFSRHVDHNPNIMNNFADHHHQDSNHFDDLSNHLVDHHTHDPFDPYKNVGVDVAIDESYHGHDRGLGIIDPPEPNHDFGAGHDHNF